MALPTDDHPGPTLPGISAQRLRCPPPQCRGLGWLCQGHLPPQGREAAEGHLNLMLPPASPGHSGLSRGTRSTWSALGLGPEGGCVGGCPAAKVAVPGSPAWPLPTGGGVLGWGLGAGTRPESGWPEDQLGAPTVTLHQK